jgi:LPXTG-motif cell wall-anchored protein
MAEKAPSPEELEREIERTRDELASTIDALVDRVSPRNIAQRGVSRIKEEAEQVVAVVNAARQDLAGLRQPRDTPPGATRLPGDIPPPVLIGAGVVLVVGAVFLLRRRRR